MWTLPLVITVAVSFALLTTSVFPQVGGEKKLEVFSWWASGGEAAALGALFAAYQKQCPGVQINNATVYGAGGSAAKPLLRTRLAGGNPPDTWQAHPGRELLDLYVEQGYCESLSNLYDDQGWKKVFPSELVKIMTKDGNTYAVLVGIHRGNVLWYNKKLLQKNGITIGDGLTFGEFFAACDRLKAAGIPAIGVGDSEILSSTQLFENTLLGVIGPDAWTDLFSAKLRWDDPKVKEAMKLYSKALDYQNSDHASLTSGQALRRLMDGKVAFNSSGDWSYGEFIKAGQKANEDFGWVCFPGTDEFFLFIADGFTLARGAPDREETLAWLKVIGSKEAQERFNVIKGSIPARTDIDRRKFDLYHQWSIHSFATARLVASCVHGEAASETFVQSLNDAVTRFVEDRNVDDFAHSMVQAAQESQF
jgi:glucose/mannose transport system substrate-binding protein